MPPILQMHIARPAFTRAKFLEALDPQTFRSSNQRSLSSFSTSRPLRQLASPFRRASSPSPTRRLNEPEDEAARLHHAALWRGWVAARGARAAAGKAANHRILGGEHAFRPERMGCCLCGAFARARLD